MLPLLAGLRVVDVTTIILGPYATQILGDLGADVIKVEALDGDPMRWVPPHGAPGMSAILANHNRNKRSIALDLKRPEGRQVMARLVASADALVHNMRQQAFDRLGFSYAACHELNPSLVYCAAVGYGSDGPYAGRPAYDDVIQAGCGLADLFAMRDGTPALAPTVAADKVTALHVVYAVLAALLARERAAPDAEGRKPGAFVEVPMLEAMVSFLLTEHLAGTTFDPAGTFGYHRVVTPARKPYRTRDGHMVVLPYNPAHWRKALTEIGRDDLAKAPWLDDRTALSKRMPELYGLLAEVLPGRSTAEWLAAFERHDIPCAPVNRAAALVEEPHLAAIGHFIPRWRAPSAVSRTLNQAVRVVGEAASPDRPPPPLGADGPEILAELGFSAEEKRALLDSGAIGSSS